MKILVAHQGPNELGNLEQVLREQGHAVEEAHTAAQTLEQARRERYDMLVVDHSLRGIDVGTLCGAFRTRGIRTPVLVVATLRPEVVSSLDAGADGCIVRPFTPEELLAQARAVVRRARRERC